MRLREDIPANVNELATALFALLQQPKYREGGWTIADHSDALLVTLAWLAGAYAQPVKDHADLKWHLVETLALLIDHYQKHPELLPDALRLRKEEMN